MSRSYPIWNNITACCYQSGKSYGVKETGENNICVGSSPSNSHDFILKKMIFENNNGKAGDHIKTITKLNKIKSL